MGERETGTLENAARGPVRFPGGGSAVWLWGPLGDEAGSGVGSANPNNPSFLKSAEAAPSGEVPGTGYSICPSRV